MLTVDQIRAALSSEVQDSAYVPTNIDRRVLVLVVQKHTSHVHSNGFKEIVLKAVRRRVLRDCHANDVSHLIARKFNYVLTALGVLVLISLGVFLGILR